MWNLDKGITSIDVLLIYQSIKFTSLFFIWLHFATISANLIFCNIESKLSYICVFFSPYILFSKNIRRLIDILLICSKCQKQGFRSKSRFREKLRFWIKFKLWPYQSPSENLLPISYKRCIATAEVFFQNMCSLFESP